MPAKAEIITAADEPATPVMRPVGLEARERSARLRESLSSNFLIFWMSIT